jgi:hypothetical protein
MGAEAARMETGFQNQTARISQARVEVFQGVMADTETRK